jgi:DNA-binding transcriptional ArsR family regulator
MVRACAYLDRVITLMVERPGDLLAVRFATSPVWETVHAIRSYSHRSGSPLQRPWHQAVAGAAAELELEPLLAINPRRGYVPDFLTPPPAVPAPRIRDQLAQIRRTPLEQVKQELARSHASLAGRDQAPWIERLLADPAAALSTLTDLIEMAWRALVAPYWPRIREVLSADIAYRSRQLAERGLRHVIDRLDQRVGWTDSAITLDLTGEHAVDLDERGVILMPSAYIWPDVIAITDEPWQPTIIYPARGIARLWHRPPGSTKALSRLLGSTRATILTSLDTPASTTTIAARLNLSPSGVSRHLTTLRDARLLSTTRHGHELRYGRTQLGTALIRASTPDESPPNRHSAFW